jgi:glycosyltransferase involved in cell wall biosynthesis
VTIDVLIDCRPLTGEAGPGGIGTYIRGLLGGLAAEPDVAVRALATRDATLPAGIQLVPIARRFATGRVSVWENETLRVPRLLLARAAVFHNADNHAPIVRPRPYVQTLYDLIPLTYADPLLALPRRHFRRFAPRYASADAVVAISRHAADEGIRLLGIDPARISVVHPGVDPRFGPGGTPAQDPPYLLLANIFAPHKGYEQALAVIAALADAGYPHRLKITGGRAIAAVERVVRSSPRPDRVDVLGYADDIVLLYRAATLLLMPSRVEGWGLPAAEAMACGTPVVAFRNSSIPEVVGPGGILVKDGDVTAMVEAARRVVDSPSYRTELSGAALAHARRFTWKDAAARHVEVYRAVAKG